VSFGAFIGEGQRWHRDDTFAGEGEALPAGREDCHPGTPSEDRVDLPRNRVQEVLAIVEYEERALRRKVREHRLFERAAFERLHPKARRQGFPHRARAGHRCELAWPRGNRDQRYRSFPAEQSSSVAPD